MTYKVRNLQDDTWQVIEYLDGADYRDEPLFPCYQGSLADCEAYIRLHESGYMS